MITVNRVGPNVAWSTKKWLDEVVYVVGGEGSPTTLVAHFPGLKTVAAYPDDLTKVVSPALAIMSPDDVRDLATFYGEALTEYGFRLMIFGFIAGQGSDAESRRMRDRLMNDVVQLLSGPGESEGIDLYDEAAPGDPIGNFGVLDVRARQVPVNAPEVAADRYKFVIEAAVEYA